MDAVPETETAAANSLNTLMRMLGTSSCSAFVAAVATSFTEAAGDTVLPSGTAYTVVFLAAGLAAVVGATIAALTPRSLTTHSLAAAVPAPAAKAA